MHTKKSSASNFIHFCSISLLIKNNIDINWISFIATDSKSFLYKTFESTVIKGCMNGTGPTKTIDIEVDRVGCNSIVNET